jgi:probable rRNA maturation factor
MNKKVNNLEITIHGQVPVPFTKQKINTMIKKILKLHKSTATSIGVAFVSETKMSAYNKDYRKLNKPTDVLSFAYHKSKNLKKNIEGDIIICSTFIKKDIKGSEITFKEQLSRLLVHGILHLTGLDHAKDKEAVEMFAKQEKLLQAL